MINPNKTQMRAHIGWISAGKPPTARLREAMDRSGYGLVETTPGAPDDGDYIAPPDLAVVDIRSADISDRKITALAAQARRLAPGGGVVFLASPEIGRHLRVRLRKSGELCLTRANYALLIDVCRERFRLTKLAEETGERLKSLAAVSRLADFPPLTTLDAPPSVLVAGRPTPAALAAINAASAAASCVTSTLSVGQTMRALDHNRFDCAIFLPADEDDVLFSLARAMRRHREHRRLPIINMINDKGVLEKLESRAGADAMLTDHTGAELTARIEMLTRRGRLMGAMRTFLSDCQGEGVLDRVSKTFTGQFYAKHAARLFLRADETRRPLSLVGVTAVTAADDSAAQARTMAQAASVMRRVARAEDLIARLSRDTFVIITAATLPIDAARIAQRLEGVVANSIYRTEDGRGVFKSSVTANAVGRAPGERVEETTARLLSSLRPEGAVVQTLP